MSIERKGGAIIFVCDSCGEKFEGEQGEEFHDTWSSAKREGWCTRKIAGEWLHGCDKPNCEPT